MASNATAVIRAGSQPSSPLRRMTGCHAPATHSWIRPDATTAAWPASAVGRERRAGRGWRKRTAWLARRAGPRLGLDGLLLRKGRVRERLRTSHRREDQEPDARGYRFARHRSGTPAVHVQSAPGAVMDAGPRPGRRASIAAPRAPAVSPLGMMRIGMSACSSRCTGMPARISPRNQAWNAGEASIAPPPTMSASGSNVLTIWSKNSPSAWAWTRKMSRHIASPCSAMPRTFFAASWTSSAASSCPGYFFRNVGSSVFRMAVSEQTDSRSPTRPQLQWGSTSSRPLMRCVGIRTCPHSPPKPARPVDHAAVDDHAAAEARADDRRDRRRRRPAEDVEVAPERAGVAVVQVADGALEPDREVARQIEAGPLRVHEVGRALRAQHARWRWPGQGYRVRPRSPGPARRRPSRPRWPGRRQSAAGRCPAPRRCAPDARTGRRYGSVRRGR